jgi:hypothetical protein
MTRYYGYSWNACCCKRENMGMGDKEMPVQRIQNHFLNFSEPPPLMHERGGL